MGASPSCESLAVLSEQNPFLSSLLAPWSSCEELLERRMLYGRRMARTKEFERASAIP